MEEIYLSVEIDDVGKRLDVYLASKIENLSRSAAQKLIEDGNVHILSGKKLQKRHNVKENEQFMVVIPEPVEYTAIPQDIPLDIIFEDESLLVVNKPKGIVVHPAPGNPDGTLVNGVLFHCKGGLSGINGVIRPGIVHRIDKDTSGLLVIAKDDETHIGLSKQLAEHSMDRIYRAIAYGNIKTEEGRISLPIARHHNDRKKMAVVEGGRQSATNYKVLNRYDGYTELELKLETGRTHQIRVHLAYIGHPVAGDPIYGPQKVITSLNGQCLHAMTLGFIHPKTGERLYFEAPLPEYFVSFTNKLSKR